ncbi:MAG: substrate-binding domain-containing protein [Planctomycetota bacterium]
MAHRRKNVLLLVNESIGICRGILRGVFSYAIPAKPWVLQEASVNLDVMKLDAYKSADGAIVFGANPRLLHDLPSRGIPIVNVSGHCEDSAFPRVLPDNDAIGRDAARFFLGKGYRTFAMWTQPWSHYARMRQEAFVDEIGKDGHSVKIFFQTEAPGKSGPRVRDDAIAELTQWTRFQDEPVALFSVTDLEGVFASHALYYAGIKVPNEVAILGVDNEELKCAIAYPPLSSIAIPGQKIGYEAAAMLERMMSGADPQPKDILLPPAGVIERESTRTQAVHDPAVAAAMQYIQDHAHERISVTNVLSAVDVCRSTLERKFRAELNRTPLEEIHRAHLDQAKRMLVETDRTLAEVATGCGYRDAAHLIMHFRKQTGKTPSEYRRAFLLK